MEITKIKLKDIVPYEGNAKLHPREQVEQIKKSIQDFGNNDPIAVDENNVIIEGHGRYMALKELGYDEADCIVLKGLTEEQKNAYRLVHNKLTMNSDFDLEVLKSELDNLEMDMSQFDFDMEAIEKDLDGEKEAEEDDFDVEEAIPEEPITKLGDVWKLGRHYLMCGDSTKKEDVEKLMQGKKADLVFTDPPYGISVVSVDKKIGGDKPFGSKKGKIGGGKIVNCNEYAPIIGDETTETARKSYIIIKEFSKNQIIFGGNYFTDFLFPSRCWLVWDKENTGNFADAELAWTSFDKGVKLYKFLWNGLCREGSREVEGKKRVHPTQKPVGMLGKILNDFSKENDIILDVFGGSGSTLIACEQLNRVCYTMELDPHYCDVIIKRWESLTGGKAELVK